MFRVEFCIIQTFLEVFKIRGSFDILQNHFVYSMAKVILIFSLMFMKDLDRCKFIWQLEGNHNWTNLRDQRLSTKAIILLKTAFMKIHQTLSS